MYYKSLDKANKGEIVHEEDAFDYAWDKVSNSEEEQTDFLRCFGEDFSTMASTIISDEEAKDDFVEWFFSGNWLEVEE